jgi:hypothetical protein
MGGDFLNLLGAYGPGAASQGQPVGQAPPTSSAPDPAERIGGEKTALWRQLLPGLVGALGSGLLAGKEGAGAFAANFANAKHQQNLQLREQEHQTQKAIADQAHKAWQDLQGMDFSVLPPELSHLQGKSAELNQKYVAAISKDSPGGVAISPKEAQEIIALSSVLRGAKEKVGAFQQQEQKLNQAASPYTSAISSGSLEPPPGAERIAELGLPDSEAARLAGREAFSTAELARQQYDTPAFDESLGRMITPSQKVTLRGQQEATERAMALQEARDRAREALEGRKDDRFFAAQESMNNRFAAGLADRQDRHRDMPVAVQGVDENGNPTVQFVRRGDLEATLDNNDGKPVTFQKGRPLADRKALTYMNETLRKVDELDALSDKTPDSAGGTFGWKGKLTGFKRDTGLGTTTPEQADLVSKSRALVEEFARAKEGAVLPEPMLARLEKLVPNIGSPTFKQDLKRFKAEAARVRAEMGGGGGMTPPPSYTGAPNAPSRKYQILSVE